ncbi:MAG: alkaline phosphatase family protein [Acidobacteriota bacterium]|nr:alkaline phosphatase family protein [Acidobacteriota bacterium]
MQRLRDAAVVCVSVTAGCAFVMTVLLMVNNPTELGFLGALETWVVMFLVCLVPNGAGTLLLAALWPAVVRIRREWFEGRWSSYLVWGLIATNVVWVLWNRIGMVHQWASVRPFITWSGIVQNLMLLVVAAGIIAGGVRLRSGGRGVVGALIPWVLAVVVAVAALAWNSGNERFHRHFSLEEIRSAAGGVEPSEGAVAANGRVIVLGFDGLDWSTAYPLLQAGELPHLAGLIRRGAIGYLDNDDLSLSPNVWTTMFTGRSVRDHGIYDFRQLRLPWSGKKIPNFLVMQPSMDTFYGLRHILERCKGFGPWSMSVAGSRDRRVPTIWEVATDYNRRVVVANVIANLPARRVNGAMLKMDRAPQLDPPTVYPPALVEVWNPILPTDKSGSTDASFDEMTRAMDHEVSFSIDLFREYDAEMGIYYTHFVDSVSHTNWDFYARDDFLLADLAWSRTDEEWVDLVVANRGDRAFRSYAQVDKAVGRFVEAFPGATFIVVSDHGWTYSGFEHFGSPAGVVILSGAGIEPGADLPDPHILDIAPTVLALIDVPLSEELEAEVLADAFSAEVVVSFVESYRMPLDDAGDYDEVEMDQAEIERLKALGYIN